MQEHGRGIQRIWQQLYYYGRWGEWILVTRYEPSPQFPTRVYLLP